MTQNLKNKNYVSKDGIGVLQNSMVCKQSFVIISSTAPHSDTQVPQITQDTNSLQFLLMCLSNKFDVTLNSFQSNKQMQKFPLCACLSIPYFTQCISNSGSMMSFEVDSKPAFEIPLKDVSQATTGTTKLLFLTEFIICINAAYFPPYWKEQICRD